MHIPRNVGVLAGVGNLREERFVIFEFSFVEFVRIGCMEFPNFEVSWI